ncbi:sensor histidine kinase [Tepidanaerobacter sp. GT38]|uniref:sensor histidine kinase n=1 Tax=Tepidanaerobacter sp. GT38 TaxID=2722793 RepID=UPI001F3FDC73|nr:sensor histidine kinase [Tepidanaerobacter sp. GT38]MCG1011320.1 sensor histidine kinase [Tepidanaerobacter sp. GT38]
MLRKSRMDIEYLNEVIKHTIDAIETGQKEIFYIFEHSRQECERIERELQDLKVQVKATIEKVDDLRKQEKAAKYKLMVVSRDFEKYSEKDIKDAYEETKNIQIQLSLECQKELQLREKRDDLERSLRSMQNILKQSEHLMMQLGVALGFLKGDLKDVSGHISDINEKRNLAAQVIKAQEEERRRVARDIHDGPAQTLANIVIQTEICERLLEIDLNEAKKELYQLKYIVRSCLQELRKIIFNLRPSSLDDLGLLAVAKRLCEEFQEDTGIKTDFLFFGDIKRLDSDIEVTLYRIIQEALNNVRKHSRAKNCTVKIEYGNQKINLIIADNGVGFNIYKNIDNSDEEHFGIMTIRERIALINGTFYIESTPGHGTKIFVSVPLV